MDWCDICSDVDTVLICYEAQCGSKAVNLFIDLCSYSYLW